VREEAEVRHMHVSGPSIPGTAEVAPASESVAIPHPLVSVVIPTFGRPELLSRALASVLAQTYAHWEAVVVDDNDPASTARAATRRVMRGHADEPRIRYVEHDRNAGLPAARNTGIDASSGPLIAFLDDDDAWLSEKLQAQVAVFAARDDVALVYTGRLVVDGDGRLQRTERADPRGLDRAELVEANRVHTPSSVMCRRSALLAVGAFDEAMPALEDWDLYLRLGDAYAFALVEEPLTVYYRHDGGRMMEDHATLIRAHERLHRKHVHGLGADRTLHAACWRRYARALLRAGRRGAARRAAWRALSAQALDRRTLKLLLQVQVGEAGVDALSRSNARLRGLFGRGGTASPS
jgi:glycosyltransferase involved in cell wall biosynthesis